MTDLVDTVKQNLKERSHWSSASSSEVENARILWMLWRQFNTTELLQVPPFSDTNWYRIIIKPDCCTWYAFSLLFTCCVKLLDRCFFCFLLPSYRESCRPPTTTSAITRVRVTRIHRPAISLPRRPSTTPKITMALAAVPHRRWVVIYKHCVRYHKSYLFKTRLRRTSGSGYVCGVTCGWCQWIVSKYIKYIFSLTLPRDFGRLVV